MKICSSGEVVLTGAFGRRKTLFEKMTYALESGEQSPKVQFTELTENDEIEIAHGEGVIVKGRD